jgi:hypothetical protein
MTTLPVIAYLRSARHNPTSTAIDHQRQLITQWAAQTGHTVTEWVEEYGHAGAAFDHAVQACAGKLAVAVDPFRIARDITVLQAKAAEVAAAGGRLGFVEGWPEQPWQDRITDLVVDYENGRRADIATYRRRRAGRTDKGGPQQ